MIASKADPHRAGLGTKPRAALTKSILLNGRAKIFVVSRIFLDSFGQLHALFHRKKNDCSFYFRANMPKLQERDVERNQIMIEKAALHVFIRQGFHGTSVRDISREAGISLGNLYNYYETKEDIYLSLVQRYIRRMVEIQQDTLKHLLGRFDDDSLLQLAHAVRDIVYNHSDYWRLMYIDVVEFGNRHFVNSFRQVSLNLEKLAGGFPKRVEGIRPGVDLPAAYTAVYMSFFTYFLTEELFGGKQHMGLPEQQAIEQLIGIFQNGVKEPAGKSTTKKKASSGRGKK